MMPAWVVLHIVFDLGLVGVILWLSWRPNTAMPYQRTRLAELVQSADAKIAQLHALLQDAGEVLTMPLGAMPTPPRSSPPTPSRAANAYEEAARLAHAGYTVEEIAGRVQLPREEINLIRHVTQSLEGV